MSQGATVKGHQRRGLLAGIASHLQELQTHLRHPQRLRLGPVSLAGVLFAGLSSRKPPISPQAGRTMTATSAPASQARPPGSAVPPEEQFWKRYSPHGEMPLSVA